MERFTTDRFTTDQFTADRVTTEGIERLGVGELEVGQTLDWPVYDDKGILLYNRGATITSAKQLHILLRRGLYRKAPEQTTIPQRRNKASLQTGFNPFAFFHEYAERLEHCFDLIGNQYAHGVELCIRLTQDIQQLCQRSPDTILGAIHLYHDVEYVISHPLHTALLCEIFARHLKWNARRRLILVCAALTANISILQLQKRLDRQTDKLSDEQQAQMRNHPLHSANMLAAAGVDHETWLKSVTQHHERMDGSGYQGLKGKQIIDEARIIAVADIYTAMVVGKNYRSAHPAKAILRRLFLNKGREHDEQLCLLLIKLLGVFPPGTFVQLENGETAVVVKRAGDREQWPHAAAVLDMYGVAYSQPTLRNCNHSPFRIREMGQVQHEQLPNLKLIWSYYQPALN